MDHRSPWLTIWTQPKATIMQIVAHNPNQGLWWLASIYGFCSLMNLFQSMYMGMQFGIGAILIFAIILAPIWGYISFSVWSAFVTWTGKWLKGQGHFKAVRAAYAWSCVPLFVNIPLWILMVILLGQQLFMNNLPSETPGARVTAMFLILVAKVVLAIWSLVIYLNALASVQHFSVLKAIGNVILAGVVVSILSFVVWQVMGYVMDGQTVASLFLMNFFQ